MTHYFYTTTAMLCHFSIYFLKRASPRNITLMIVLLSLWVLNLTQVLEIRTSCILAPIYKVWFKMDTLVCLNIATVILTQTANTLALLVCIIAGGN